MKAVAMILGRAVLVAGWAPASVFALHVLISRGTNGYAVIPSLDIVVHFLGGAAMSYFILRCVAMVPADAMDRARRRVAESFVVVTATTTTAVLWEFAEFASDRLFGTHAQSGLEDTLLDMAIGIAGSLSLVAVAWRRGGAHRPTIGKPQG